MKVKRCLLDNKANSLLIILGNVVTKFKHTSNLEKFLSLLRHMFRR